MGICAACGANLPEGARFCPACAAPVRAAQAAQERKLATMLFADLVGSTAFASDQDPERTRLLLDRFYGEMADQIRAVGGTLEKFAGDAVMAVFGAPIAYEDHVERALHAALSMRRRFDELFADRLGLRTGVNTGEVVFGRPGEGSSFATGDAVNVAARLEQAAAAGEILVGERTAAAAGSAFEFGAPRVVEAKGKPEGVRCRPVLRALSLMRPRGVGDLRRAFIGREREVEVLRDAYRRVVELGSPQFLTISGEAGVGKTRLVREFWGSLALEDPEPVRRVGRCLPYGGAGAYAPIGQIVKEQFALLDSDPPARVREVLGDRWVLGLTLGLDVTGDIHPLLVKDRLKEAWSDFVRELLAERPAVLLIEDVHWAEPALAELLQDAAMEGPLLLLATTRPDPAPRLHGETLRVEPLTGLGTEQLLMELLGSQPPPALGNAVARAEGNPFFIEEILSMLIDRGLLAREEGSWELAVLPSSSEVPDSIHSLVASRIDLLPPTEKAALQAGAVIGNVFWSGPVGELLGGAEPDFALLEERGFAFARQPSSFAGETEYAIRHQLTREIAYDSTPKGRRARLHLGFATWLERFGEARDEHAALFAHHYSEALRSDYADLAWPDEPETPTALRPKATAWLQRAAELAIGRYEIDQGLSMLGRALELATSDQARAAAWRQIGRANALRYDGEAFWTALERSLESDDDPASRAETYSLLAFETSNRGAMWRRKPSSEIVDGWVQRALELAEPLSEARARALVASAYWHPKRGGEWASEAHTIADRLDNLELRSFAWGALAAAAFEEGRFEDAYSWTQRRLEVLSDIGDPDRVAEILELAAPAVTALGRMSEGRELVRQGEELSARLSPHHRLHTIAQSVDVEELAGSWATVRELTTLVEERAAANLDTPCVRNARSLLQCTAAWALQGHDKRARELEREADELQMDGYDYALDPPRLRLALIRDDERAIAMLLDRPPPKTYTMGPGALAARLDGLAALNDRRRVEAEAPPLLRPGIYLEPFAMRALGVVRGDARLMEDAIARFEAMDLGWHADQTRETLSSLP